MDLQANLSITSSSFSPTFGSPGAGFAGDAGLQSAASPYGSDSIGGSYGGGENSMTQMLQQMEQMMTELMQMLQQMQGQGGQGGQGGSPFGGGGSPFGANSAGGQNPNSTIQQMLQQLEQMTQQMQQQTGTGGGGSPFGTGDGFGSAPTGSQSLNSLNQGPAPEGHHHHHHHHHEEGQPIAATAQAGLTGLQNGTTAGTDVSLTADIDID